MRTCACGAPISLRSRGRCHPCAAVDPERRAKIAEAQRKRWADRLTDPDERRRAIESGRALSRLHPPTRERVEQQQASREKLAWCPPQYAGLNTELRRKRIPAAERRRVIADQAAADERARLAAMTPFERQMDRVRQGAGITECVPMPSRQYGTLGGVSGGML
jgi:hypothetical protein